MVMVKKIRLSFCVLASMSLFFLGGCGAIATDSTSGIPGATAMLNVVAAENFYGDIVKQLGGNHVNVASILSDPNIDPHEYEASAQNAIAIQKADLVIENGLGYDAWMDKLLSASPNTHRNVLTAGNVADHKLPDNPHVWYGFDNILTIAQSITGELKRLDSTDATVFDRNFAAFQQSVKPLQQILVDLRARYNGVPVALTETIYLYQTIPIGLKVLTPFAFEKAIAEGNDPPADTVIAANDQISQKQVKVLIYNQQTVSPITTNLQNAAKKLHIPIVPVTETMPLGKTYQSWMKEQLTALQQALSGQMS
ncbi:MAG TPA: zinc ABC transporter substrate-binding protein [Ktedonobacteraceae bacterium]|nr:zinc ABC transporter substrate-binding protein [Ktedonobacteraceae bacterium]